MRFSAVLAEDGTLNGDIKWAMEEGGTFYVYATFTLTPQWRGEQ
jgi:hypothetical protein